MSDKMFSYTLTTLASALDTYAVDQFHLPFTHLSKNGMIHPVFSSTASLWQVVISNLLHV